MYAIAQLIGSGEILIGCKRHWCAVSASLDLESLVTSALLLVLVLCIVGVAYLSVTSAPPDAGQNFTEFYILGENGTADGYPTSVRPNETVSVRIGVRNLEHGDESYVLTVSWDEKPRLRRQLRIPYNETWEKPVTVKAPAQPGEYWLTFELYRSQNTTTPYRNLRLKVEVKSSTER